MKQQVLYNNFNKADRDLSPTRQATYLFSAFLLIGLLLRSKIMRKQITQKELKSLVIYYPETGVFFNRETGKVIGGLHINERIRYWQIRIKGFLKNRSQWAWVYMEGYSPNGYDIDHKNRIRHDDKWRNLRLATRQCNARNSKVSKANKSGVTGVTWDREKSKWAAHIYINYKTIRLGRFKSKADAVKARWQGEKDNNFPSCNTHSSSYLYLKERGLTT